MKRKLLIVGALLVVLAGVVWAQQDPFFVVQNPRGLHITAGTQFPSIATTGTSPGDGQMHIQLIAGGTANPVLWLYGNNAAAWLPVSPIGAGVGDVPSTLATNAVDVANSVWGGTGELIFEGANVDAFENEIRTAEPTGGVATFLLPDQAVAADIYPIMFSVMATNAFEVANSVWMDTNQVVWEGATPDVFETLLIAEDADLGIHTFQLPDNNAVADTYMVMFSLLDTNALQAANSIWFDTDMIVAEGAGVDAFETQLTFSDVGQLMALTIDDYGVAAASLVGVLQANNEPETANSLWVDQTRGMVYEGAGVDAFETVVAAADATVAVHTYAFPDRPLAFGGATISGIHASDEDFDDEVTYMWPPYAEVATVAHTSDVNDDLYCHRLYLPERIAVENMGVVLEDGGALAVGDIVGAAIYHDTDAAASQIATGNGDGTAAGLEDIDITDITIEPGMYRICICTSDQTNMLFSAVAPAGVDADWELLADIAGDVIFGVAAQTCTAGVPPAFTGAIAADDDEQIMFVLH